MAFFRKVILTDSFKRINSENSTGLLKMTKLKLLLLNTEE